ncbi:MAG: S4 domain-containing protein, partial [Cetobacterium sp.]
MEGFKDIIEVKVSQDDRGKRLDAFLSEFFENTTRNYIQKLIDNQNVTVDGKEKVKNGSKLKGNEFIIIRIP